MTAEYSRRIQTRLRNAIRSCDPATLKVGIRHRGYDHRLGDVVVRWVRVQPASAVGPARRYPQWLKVGTAWLGSTYDHPLTEAELIGRLASFIQAAVQYIEGNGGVVANKAELVKYVEADNAGTS